jgi:hypothetical protein
VTREKIRDKIAAVIETKFSGSVRDADGTTRPHLDQQDCRFIADLVLSEMGPAGLRNLQSKAKNDNAPSS